MVLYILTEVFLDIVWIVICGTCAWQSKVWMPIRVFAGIYTVLLILDLFAVITFTTWLFLL